MELPLHSTSSGSFPHLLRGLIPATFAQHPSLASYVDNHPNISKGVLNIIITFAKYEQYLVYVMFIVDIEIPLFDSQKNH